jgi:hypothetical protein
MRKIAALTFLLITLYSCKKDDRKTNSGSCDIDQTYITNASKVTITSGVWGTLSAMEGNCMPMVGPGPTDCKHCPAQRTMRIYQYTRHADATPSGTSTVFFDSFNTRLVAEVNTDADGFFQATIPPGTYTMVVVINGKLYASVGDVQGGINPFTVAGLEKVNVIMTYQAVF